MGNTIGSRIKLLRGKEARPDFAKRFNMSVATLARYESDETAPNADLIVTICDTYNISPEWLLFDRQGQGLSKTIKNDGFIDKYVSVPKVAAELAAGHGSFLDSSEVIEELGFRREWLAGKGQIKDFVVMTVWGDSMEPTLKNKDLALINLAQNIPHNSCIYAIAHDEALYIKRLVVEPGRLLLRSDNKNYSDIILSYDDHATMDKVKIIGRAVWWCHDDGF